MAGGVGKTDGLGADYTLSLQDTVKAADAEPAHVSSKVLNSGSGVAEENGGYSNNSGSGQKIAVSTDAPVLGAVVLPSYHKAFEVPRERVLHVLLRSGLSYPDAVTLSAQIIDDADKTFEQFVLLIPSWNVQPQTAWEAIHILRGLAIRPQVEERLSAVLWSFLANPESSQPYRVSSLAIKIADALLEEGYPLNSVAALISKALDSRDRTLLNRMESSSWQRQENADYFIQTFRDLGFDLNETLSLRLLEVAQEVEHEAAALFFAFAGPLLEDAARLPREGQTLALQMRGVEGVPAQTALTLGHALNALQRDSDRSTQTKIIKMIWDGLENLSAASLAALGQSDLPAQIRNLAVLKFLEFDEEWSLAMSQSSPFGGVAAQVLLNHGWDSAQIETFLKEAVYRDDRLSLLAYFQNTSADYLNKESIQNLRQLIKTLQGSEYKDLRFELVDAASDCGHQYAASFFRMWNIYEMHGK